MPCWKTNNKKQQYLFSFCFELFQRESQSGPLSPPWTVGIQTEGKKKKKRNTRFDSERNGRHDGLICYFFFFLYIYIFCFNSFQRFTKKSRSEYCGGFVLLGGIGEVEKQKQTVFYILLFGYVIFFFFLLYTRKMWNRLLL